MVDEAESKDRLHMCKEPSSIYPAAGEKDSGVV